MPSYTDFDYEALPVPDHHSGRDWILLPAPQWRAVCEARRRADEAELKQKHPDHRVVLIKSHPTYSPTQSHLWPLVNDAIIAVIEKHPVVYDEVCACVRATVEAHRGWRNPHPVSVETPRHLQKKNKS